MKAEQNQGHGGAHGVKAPHGKTNSGKAPQAKPKEEGKKGSEDLDQLENMENQGEKPAEKTSGEDQQKALQEALEQVAASQDAYLRLAAEYENFRRRTTKEKVDLYDKSVGDVVKAWLPVLDNIDRALEACPLPDETSEDFEPYVKMKEGIELIQKQALETMKGFEVEEIQALDQTFNPHFHEAVMHTTDPERGEGEVVEVVLKGYVRRDEVLRHAMVVVAN